MRTLAPVAIVTLALLGCESKPAPTPGPAPAATDGTPAAAKAPETAGDPTPEPAGHSWTLLTAAKDGNYHAAGTQLAEVIKGGQYTLDVKESPGSFHNVNAVGSGKADMAMAQYDTIMVYHNQGDEGRKIAEGAKVFAPIGREFIHVLAGKDTGIKSINDLVGRRIGVGPLHSGSWISAWAVMHHLHNIDVEKDESMFKGEHAEQLEKLIAGDLDAIFITTAPGMPLLAKVDKEQAARIKMLGVATDYVLAAPLSDVYDLSNVPAGTYPFQPDAVKTYYTRSYLLIGADLDTDAVKGLAAAVFSKDKVLAAKNGPWKGLEAQLVENDLDRAPYHPGVAAHFGKTPKAP